MDISPVDQALGTTGSPAPVSSDSRPAPLQEELEQTSTEAPLREYEGTKVDTTV